MRTNTTEADLKALIVADMTGNWGHERAMADLC